MTRTNEYRQLIREFLQKTPPSGPWNVHEILSKLPKSTHEHCLNVQREILNYVRLQIDNGNLQPDPWQPLTKFTNPTLFWSSGARDTLLDQLQEKPDPIEQAERAKFDAETALLEDFLYDI